MDLDDKIITDLLVRWQQLHDAGHPISADELCQEHPALIDQVRAHLDQLKHVDDGLGLVGPSTRDAVAAPAQMLGHYQLISMIGEGGFGEVWKAIDPQLNRVVAIKKSRTRRAASPENLRREAQAAGNLKHPGIVSMYHWGDSDGHLFIVSEWIDGTDLRRVLKVNPPTFERTAELVCEIADALNYIHSRDLVHRDIKPANILIDRQGHAVLTDFGIALTEKEILSEAFTTSGTAPYLAPEMIRADRLQIGPATDVYSLGVVLYELLTGRVPFRGETLEDVFRQVQSRIPPSPRSCNGYVPPELERICLKAIQKSPADRYPSAKALADDLRAYLETSRELPPEPATSPEHPPPARSPSWRWQIVLTACAICLVPVGWIVFRPSHLVQPSTASIPRSEGTRRLDSHAQQPLSKPASAWRQVSLAVLGFESHTTDARFKSLGAGIRDMLTTDLSRISQLQLIERARLREVLAEHKLAATEFIDPARAVQVGRGVSAAYVLTGSCSIINQDIRIDTRLVSVETGEVELGEGVAGKIERFFELERTLAEKLLHSLKIVPLDSERLALGRASSKNFEAFCLYSQAADAINRDQNSEAENSLEAAVALDPDFALATDALSSLQERSSRRLSQLKQQRLSLVDKTGVSLKEHLQRYEQVLSKGRYDQEYFAALPLVSAHAGLLGDFDREKSLLQRYWQEYTQHISPTEALSFFSGVNDIVTREGQFFQELVDSGVYMSVTLDGDSTREFLKPELRNQLTWPRSSGIWPFNEDLRSHFHVAQSGINDAKIPFEQALPHFPHDYLTGLLETLSKERTKKKTSDVLTLRGSIIRYYLKVPTVSAAVGKSFKNLADRFMKDLTDRDATEYAPEFVTSMLPILEMLSRSAPTRELQEVATQTLLSFARFTQKDNPSASQPGQQNTVPELFGIPLKGPRITIVRELKFVMNRLHARTQQQCRSMLLALGTTHLLNLGVFGGLTKPQQAFLFDAPRPVDRTVRDQGIRYLTEDPSPFVEEDVKFGGWLARALGDWPKDATGEGDLVIVCHAPPEIPPQVLDLLRGRPRSCPRISVIFGRSESPDTQRETALERLAVLTGGSAAALVASDITGLDFEALAVDLTKIQVDR